MIDKKHAIENNVNIIDNTKNMNHKSDLIQKIKSLLPEIINSDNQLNIEALKNILDISQTTSNNKGYELTFAGKGIARAMAATETTKELKVEKAQSKNFDSTENVVIRGDNLEVLKILKQNYFEKIKMIYIDPPYNTTSEDFIYNDNFKQSEEELIQNLGLGEETSNFLHNVYGTRSHSGWLAFMYPRLKLARDLLRDDGVIFISIDDNEQANLKIMCDEIFGEENFRNQIAVKRGAKSVQSQFESIDKLGISYEVILCYTKNNDLKLPQFYFHLNEEKEGSWNNHWRGTDRPTMRYKILGCNIDTGQWRWSKNRSEKAIRNYNNLLEKLNTSHPSQKEIDQWFEENEGVDLLRLSSNGKPEHYVPSTDKRFGHNLWVDLLAGKTSALKNLEINYFDNPKNPDLIIRLSKWITLKNDIILDFFAGSGTTGDAVMQLNAEDGGNRKYILVQWDEAIAENTEAHKFCTENNFEPVISSICIERLNRAGEKIRQEQKAKNGMFDDEKLDIGYKVFSLTEKQKIIETTQNNQPLFQLANKRTSTENTLYNMLCATRKSLDTKIQEIIKDKLYMADDELYLLSTITSEELEPYKDHKINIDGYSDISLEQWLNLGVGDQENVRVVY